MFNKYDVPVSLFSFQDIVTTLIGVMIIFVLLFSLEFLQNQENQLAASKYYNHIKALIEEKRLAEEDLQKTNEIYAMQVKHELDVIAKDPLVLQSKIDALTEEQNKLLIVHDEKLAVEEELKQSISIELSKGEKITKEQEETIQKYDSLEKDYQNGIDSLSQEKERIKKRIEESKKHLDIVFDSSSSKKPLIIQCSGTSIKVGVYGDNNSKSFAVRNNNYESSVIQHISQFSQRSYYLVLLVKPSFSSLYDDFLTSIRSSFPNHEIGTEPIFEDEDCL